MADRTVTARLRLDVDAYIADAKRAEAATKAIADQADRSGVRIQRSQTQTQDSTDRTATSFEHAGDAADHAGRKVEQAALAARRAQLAAVEATQKAEAAQKRAAAAAEALAKGELDEAKAAHAAAAAQNAAERASIARAAAVQRATAAEEAAQHQHEETAHSAERAGVNTATWLTSLGAAAAGMSSSTTAAGLAVAAFAGMAVPSIKQVVTAQKDLVGNWELLSDRQKVTSGLVQGLIGDYQNLAKSYEPEALASFNSVLLSARTLLPQVGQVVNQTGFAVQGFASKIGRFVEGPEMQGLLNDVGKNAPQALSQLGDITTSTASTITGLTHALMPTGATLLTATRGLVGFADAATHVSPALTEAAVTTLMLRGPTMALSGFVSGAASKMGSLASSTRDATGASRGLAAIAKMGPTVYVAAGVALAYLAVRMSSVRDATDGLIDKLQMQSKAYGNNIEGHLAMASALQVELRAAQAAAQAAADANTAVAEGGSTGRTTTRVEKLTAAYNDQLKAADNVRAGQIALAHEFGITSDSANRLATAAGIDLSQGILKSGELTAEARKKIADYRLAVEAASNSTTTITLALQRAADTSLLMKDRMTALQQAMDAQFSPSINVYQLTTQLSQGFRELSTTMAKAKASMDGNTTTSFALRQAFAQQLISVANLRTAVFQQTGSLDSANAAAAKYLPILYALAGRSSSARAQVDALARTMGFSVTQTTLSHDAFVRQAQAMLGSRQQAEALWRAYQKLTGGTVQGGTALNSYIAKVRAAAAATYQQSVRTGGASGAQSAFTAKVAASLPILYTLAGRNKEARSQVDALARSAGVAGRNMDVSKEAFYRAASAMGIARGKADQLWRQFQQFKPTDVPLTVTAVGTWDASRAARPELRATGGPITGEYTPGASRAYDSVPAMLRVDEHVWTPEEVDSVGGHGAMYRLRSMARAGRLRGYATGGPVSLTSAGTNPVPPVYQPIYSGINGLIDNIGRAFADAWKKFAGSGGPVIAAARTQVANRTPYVWGGTSWNVGLDCSGLTSQSWQRGKGVWIGRTTYDQYPASTHMDTPRPGALGFPHMGHVVLFSGNGHIIEEPFTGEVAREVPISRNYEWRWPNAAKFATGGAVGRFGQDFVGGHVTRNEIALASLLGIAGNPRPEDHTAQIARPRGPVRMWAEPETGGEAYIPLAQSKRGRSTAILAAVAKQFGWQLQRMADGGILGYADGGLDTVNLSDILSNWTNTVKPASSSDVASAKKNVSTQKSQVAAAKRALAKAERARRDKIHDAEKRLRRAYESRGKGRANRIEDAKEALRKAKRTDAIRAAEAKLRKERNDLADATRKLTDTERRYQYARQSPATQLGSALALSIKNKGAFIANLQKLADRGFGGLARNLLAMGDDQAEKIAADAVKLSDSKLRGLQGQLNTAERQQQTLTNLPNILTVRSSLKSLGTKGGSWVALLNATGLGPGDLATAVHLMAGDLSKSATGKALLADMRAHGYASGGWIVGRSGVDQVPIRATAGEYMVRRTQAAKFAPLVEAINRDSVGDAILRRYIPGSRPLTRGGDGASAAAPRIEQHFHELPYSPAQMAREAARQAAWTLGS